MPLLDREEYIEQAYFFRTFHERLEEHVPAQEILELLREEILATTRLPLAIDVLRGELRHTGQLHVAMNHLQHYFTPFQIYVVERAEADQVRFDLRIGLQILERAATYLSEQPTAGGLFVYQFESLARNRLGYDQGLEAILRDPIYDDAWRSWLRHLRTQIGVVEFADLVFFRSQYYVDQRRKTQPDFDSKEAVLFGVGEGRIAKANRGKDPLYLFAALQRQLNYPAVPRRRPEENQLVLHPQLETRLAQLEKRLQMIEAEAKGKLDLSQFYLKADEPDGRPASPGDSNGKK